MGLLQLTNNIASRMRNLGTIFPHFHFGSLFAIFAGQVPNICNNYVEKPVHHQRDFFPRPELQDSQTGGVQNRGGGEYSKKRARQLH